MQAKIIALALALAASAMAWPSAEPTYVDVSSEPASGGNGTIVYVAEQKRGWFGPDPVCGMDGNAPKCDGKHGAQNEMCLHLLTDLNSNPDIVVQRKPRQLCYKGNGGYCCVSWSKEVKTDIKKKDLAPYVEKLSNTCTQNGISGLIRSVNLGNVGCGTICLSDRGTGCK